MARFAQGKRSGCRTTPTMLRQNRTESSAKSACRSASSSSSRNNVQAQSTGINKLNSRRRIAAAAWLIPICVSMSIANAEPVTDTAPEVLPRPGDTMPNAPLDPTEAGQVGATAPPARIGLAASSSVDSTPSPAEDAAAIISEALAGAAAPAATRPATPSARQAARAASSARPHARLAEDDVDLKEMGKRALSLLKQVLPGQIGDADKEGADDRAVTDSADWSTSPLDGITQPHGGHIGAAPTITGLGAAQSMTNALAGGSGDANLAGHSADVNIVREIVDAIRMVFGHPMTWMIVALFAIGGIAVSKFDRRPK